MWSFSRRRSPSRRGFRLAAALLALAAGLPLPCLSIAGEGEGDKASPGPTTYVVVVSDDVEVTGIGVEELRRLFLFQKKHWKAGKRATVLLSEEGLEEGSFLLTEIYRMEYPALRRFILEKLYRGEIDLAPKVAATDKLTARFVARGKGLLSLVNEEATAGIEVRVLAIDGHRPGSEGYPLQR